MSRIFFYTFTFLLGFVSFAQSQTSEHMTFKGVPIDGTLNSYISKMKQNGFILMSTGEGMARLKGDFAGYKNCIVEVATLSKQDLVHRIAVKFQSQETWSTLSGNYFDFKTDVN